MADQTDSRQAVIRLVVTLVLMTIGSGGMYIVAVVLPSMQAEFGVARADASLPYALMMIGFGIGGILMGRLAHRYGVMVPILIGATGLACGFVAAGMTGSIWAFALAHGVLLGLLGCSATFAPLVADTSLWFVKRRGIAVAPAAEAGARVGTVLMCTLLGMALGGWMSGKVFDLTGSYDAAFLNGIAWNLLNLSIVLFLLHQARRVKQRAVPAY